MDIHQQIEQLLQNAKFYRTCLSCDHFEEHKELCAKANSRPPARIIVLGCPAYKERIPF